MPVAWISRERLRKTFGWCFGTWVFLIFHSVVNVIIPTDEIIFFGGVAHPPTRHVFFVCQRSMWILSDFMGRVMGFLPTNMGIDCRWDHRQKGWFLNVFDGIRATQIHTDVDVMGYDWNMMKWWGKCNEHVIYDWLNMIFGWKILWFLQCEAPSDVKVGL